MAIKLITPQMKDLALEYLLSSNSLEIDISNRELSQYCGCLPFQVNLILEEFEKLDLLSIESTNDGITVTISAKAYDMHAHGGFTAQEELLKANINKLGYELEVLSKELEPKHLEKAEKISSIAMAVLSALTLFKS